MSKEYSRRTPAEVAHTSQYDHIYRTQAAIRKLATHLYGQVNRLPADVERNNQEASSYGKYIMASRYTLPGTGKLVEGTELVARNALTRRTHPGIRGAIINALDERWVGVEFQAVPSTDVEGLVRPVAQIATTGRTLETRQADLSTRIASYGKEEKGATQLRHHNGRLFMASLGEASLVATSLRETYGVRSDQREINDLFEEWCQEVPSAYDELQAGGAAEIWTMSGAWDRAVTFARASAATDATVQSFYLNLR